MESVEKTREELLISQKLLQKEIDMLYGALERVSDGIVAFDEAFNYTYVNLKGAELLGRSVNELIGKNYWVEFPEAQGTSFANAYLRAMNTQEFVMLEDYYEHWNQWYVNRIYPSKEGITIFFSNITQQKVVAESIAKSEDRFRSIFNNLQDAFLQCDLSNKLTLVSPSTASMFGYQSADEMIGLPVLELYANPVDRELMNAVLSEHNQVVDYIVTAKRKDGSSFWTSMSVYHRYFGSEIIGYEAVIRDITERKKHEDQIKTLSTVVDQSPSMIVITDKSGNIEYVNAEFSRFTQYSSREVIGRIPLIFNEKYHTPESYATMWETLREGKPWISEFKNRKKEGDIFWENITAFPLTSADGLIRNYIIISDDITDKRQLLDDLVKSKEKAEESDRLKSAFLANMSHEIRTPMNGILGFTELLKEPNLSGTEQQFYIQVITESGNRMLNLMNNLIDISRIESGEVKIIHSTFDIKKKFEHLFDFFNQEAKAKGLRLIYKCNLLSDDFCFETDVQKLDSILENLVKNAIKFTRIGTIEFGCEKSENYYKFFVKDSGTGIDPEHQGIIFDRFRQASESLSRPYEGAGLGLSISKAYVEILGGKIWVESEIDKGTTFHFTLPDRKETKQDIFISETHLTKKNMTIPSKLKLLLVEDDDVSMNFMEIIAEKFCKEIYKANTGAEAVTIFRNNQDINIILMDIKLPVMDGLEATRQIRQFNKEVVILAQTAYSMVGDREKAIAAGCDDYISKPIDMVKLKALVMKYANV